MIFPDGSMIVKAHSKMIANQILGRNTHIHRIPVFEFMSHFGKFFFRYFTSIYIRSLLEYIIPAAVIKILCINSKTTSALTLKITLKHVSNCIVSHVNS
jgi:hypothetical protein